MFDIIGPQYESFTRRGFVTALEIARETARLIGWAKVFENGTLVLTLRRPIA